VSAAPFETVSRRIVINCWGSYGDVYPYVGLAAELKARGHTPVIATAAMYRDTVERAGIEYAHVGPDLEHWDEKTLYARVKHPTKGSEVNVRELLMPKLEETYEQLRAAAAGAELLVAHPITYAAPVLAERERLPWVQTILAPMLFFSIYDPPVFPQTPALAHAPKLGTWAARLMVGLARRATEPWCEPVYRLREKLGLPRGLHPMFGGLFSPYLTLALFSRALGTAQPDWPTNDETTGFVFYNGKDALAPELEAFLASGPPPVVFTLGTSAVGAAGSFYRESAEAARRLGRRAVLLTGGIERNRDVGAPSTDVLLVDRAPHQLLFPRASAVVHQGGVGTTGQALRSGHPMIVVPHGHDQPDNAARVARLGVSRTIYPQRYRAARVARELERLLADGYAKRAAATAAVVRAEDGAGAAAAALERVLDAALTRGRAL
jgi:UDP:flavonoid glycosyltransferase YjiC (YdhE family)